MACFNWKSTLNYEYRMREIVASHNEAKQHSTLLLAIAATYEFESCYKEMQDDTKNKQTARQKRTCETSPQKINLCRESDTKWKDLSTYYLQS